MEATKNSIICVALSHRLDIKPKNILIDAQKDVVRLADFGTSKRVTQRNTYTMAYPGTTLYAAPEVVARQMM